MSSSILSAKYPTITQQRALAYAPKPFAALSFLSCIFVMYYLIIRHPEKRKRLYHRLMLASFICFLPLSVVLFIGTWAMPEVPWAVGEKGTTATCTVQAFFFLVFYLAFPFYYASLSIYAYIAVKNNFQEEKYVWIEKWIHIGAYLVPLCLAIVCAAKGWFVPGLTFCRNDMQGKCDIFKDEECHHEHAIKSYSVFTSIITIEMLIGTATIITLLCTFDKLQKRADEAIGMQRIVGNARRQRLKQVACQTGLYLLSFWFGYFPKIVDRFVRMITGQLNFDLIITANCVFALQGFTIMVIYFALQQRSHKEEVKNILHSAISAPDGSRHDTVSKIRANAARQRRKSSILSSSLVSKYSFKIFDGSPAQDSPWAAYFEDESLGSGLVETVVEEDLEETQSTDTSNLTTSLLERM